MEKILNINLVIINILVITNFIIVNIYDINLDSLFTGLKYKDTIIFSKLKKVFSDPLYNLYLTLMIFEFIYSAQYLILNNKKISQYLGLNVDKIAKQTSTGFSNLIIELFFSLMIKGLGLGISLFLIFKAKAEITQIINYYEVNDVASPLETLKKADFNLQILNYLNYCSIAFYMSFYFLKFLKIRKLKK